MEKFTAKIDIPSDEFDNLTLFGSNDKYLMEIEEKFSVKITLRDNKININSDNEKNLSKAKELLSCMIKRIQDNSAINDHTFNYLLNLIDEEKKDIGNFDQVICYTFKGKPIKTKTIGQSAFINATKRNDIVFSIGPAGTGKTYLAVALAVKALKNGDVSRIILTRPAVEAGESLGFLPGDLKEKIDPYLKPLYDALFDIMGS